MSNEIDFKFVRPFGPMICKVTIPENIVNILNEYVDKTIVDKKKVNELDYGSNLAGNVEQEFKLEKEFVKNSGWGRFLSGCAEV